MKTRSNLDLLNADGLDDSIFYSSADGLGESVFYSSADGESETENEDSVEDEGEGSEAGVDEQDLPKFRTLVRNKKLEMKAQYGKAHFKSVKHCTDIKYPCFKKGKLTTCVDKECINTPSWQWGWRKEWRSFKRNGGLAQLKMQSKGLAPIPSTTPPPAVPVSRLKPVMVVNGATKVDLLSKTGDGKSPNGKSLSDTSNADNVSDDKILGMPKMVVYVLGAVLVLGGGFFVYKKYIKK